MPVGRKPRGNVPVRRPDRRPNRVSATSSSRPFVSWRKRGSLPSLSSTLVDALEFSKANFYHHIESKEELLYEIFLDTLRTARVASRQS